MSTSLTDTPGYRAACLEAATDPRAFETFRVHPELEHVTAVSRELGWLYRLAVEADVDVVEWLDTLRRADSVGSPREVDEDGVSPTTWRYAHALARIGRLFQLDEAFVVKEIGGGYGGQAFLASELVGCAWAIVDLPEVCLLQTRYLREFGLGLGSRPAPAKIQRCDLLVSAYAFSELTVDTQAQYLIGHVADADRGYLTCNFTTPSLPPDTLLEAVRLWHPGARWESEEPLTHSSNRVLVWGDGDH